MEQDAPPPPPPPCMSTAAAAAPGVGDPSSPLANTLRRLMSMSSARPQLHSLPPPLPPPPPQPTTSSAPAAAAGVGDPSSSSAAHALRRLAQPELTHYLPSLVPPPPSASASSSAAVPSYQQRPPAPVLDGSSLHARSLSQPPPTSSSFNTTAGNILSTDLEAYAAALGSLIGQMPPPQPTVHNMLFGQSNNLFGVAPAASQQDSSFLSSAGPDTMGNTLFPHLGVGLRAPPPATPLAVTHPSLLVGQQQQALPRPMMPGMLLGQRNNFAGGFGQPMLGSSSRSAGLLPRWQPSRSRTQTNPTFGSVQPDTNMGALQPMPGSSSSSSWERRLQLGGGGAHTLSAWSTSGSVSNNGRSSAAMSTEPWHCRNLSGESSTMSFMPKPPSAGDNGSLGPPSPPSKRKRRGDTFTEAEMEKIRKEKRLSDLVITDPRRVKTILCNRASAAKSAERRKNYRRGLQQQLQELEIEYTQLHGQAILQQEKLTELESQTSNLRMRLEDLDNELNLKEAINETLVSSIQSITLTDSNAKSGLPQQMCFDGQCSNGGQYQHI